LDVLYSITDALRDQPVSLHVFGEPASDAATKRWVRRLRGLPNLALGGPYSSFSDLPLAEMDLFLYTTRSDGLPNVLLEAMASSLPVIAPRVGGIPELVTTETGFLISQSDAICEYAQAIRQIIEQPQLLDAKRDAALHLIAERHTWSAFMNRLGETGFLRMPVGIEFGKTVPADCG
jgi:glycosyltransferase involved in cell wall biosynthesis